MDRPGVGQIPEGSEEERQMEEVGCEIICGVPMTLRVQGQMGEARWGCLILNCFQKASLVIGYIHHHELPVGQTTLKKISHLSTGSPLRSCRQETNSPDLESFHDRLISADVMLVLSACLMNEILLPTLNCSSCDTMTLLVCDAIIRTSALPSFSFNLLLVTHLPNESRHCWWSWVSAAKAWTAPRRNPEEYWNEAFTSENLTTDTDTLVSIGHIWQNSFTKTRPVNILNAWLRLFYKWSFYW